MKEFQVSQQKDVIDELMSHLKNGVMGLTMAEDWHYRREGNFIYFTLKEGRTPRLDVILWFGYLTNN